MYPSFSLLFPQWLFFKLFFYHMILCQQLMVEAGFSIDARNKQKRWKQLWLNILSEKMEMITLHTRLCIWYHVTWCTNWSMDFTKRRNEKQQLATGAMKHSLYWNMLSHIQLDPHRSLTLHSCHCKRMSLHTTKLVQRWRMPPPFYFS